MEEQDKTKNTVPVAPKSPNPSGVETFTDDMVKVLSEDTGGLIKKIIKEQEAAELEKKHRSPHSVKNRLFLYGSFFFTALAIGIVVFFYIKKKNETVNIVQVINPKVAPVPPFFVDKVETIEIAKLVKDTLDAQTLEDTKNKITDNILGELGKANTKTGAIEGIYLAENGKVIGLRRFIALVRASYLPGEEVFVSDNFLMGIVNDLVNKDAKDTQKDFFILLKMRSLTDIFPTLRAWEGKMLADLHTFFGIFNTPLTTPLFTKSFEDGTIENKNARILYDANRNIILTYVYMDDQSVLITTNPAAVHEILQRLSSSQIKK